MEHISLFEDAVVAFEIKFERELTSRWDRLQEAAIRAGSNADPSGRLDILNQLFDDLAASAGAVIHEYFPKLLGIATARRQEIGDQPPLIWTERQILTRSCSFFVIDEEFDGAKDPAQDSRVLRTAESVISYWLPNTIGMDEESDGAFMARVISDWDTEAPRSEFLLPWWVDSGLRLARTLAGQPLTSWSGSDAETLSRADTLKWVKLEEFELWNRLNLALEGESWEAIIEAGKTGVSVLEGCPAGETQMDGDTETKIARGQTAAPYDNTYTREGETWFIQFGGETCRIPAVVIGLDYISVLLRYAGTSISAQRLRAERAAAVPEDPKNIRELLSDSDPGEEPVLQTDLSSQNVMDAKALAQCHNEVKRLDDQIVIANDTQNPSEAKRLEGEKKYIQRELAKQLGLLGKPRRFSNQKESARSTVTHAINLALGKIEKTAPAAAQHLRDNIETGTFLVYRDRSARWKI